MLALLRLLPVFFANLFKSRRRLEAEILCLRHQLNIALRQRPARLPLRGSDRALLMWMTRLWLSLLGMARVVEPATILRWHRAAVPSNQPSSPSICYCYLARYPPANDGGAPLPAVLAIHGKPCAELACKSRQVTPLSHHPSTLRCRNQRKIAAFRDHPWKSLQPRLLDCLRGLCSPDRTSQPSAFAPFAIKGDCCRWTIFPQRTGNFPHDRQLGGCHPGRVKFSEAIGGPRCVTPSIPAIDPPVTGRRS